MPRLEYDRRESHALLTQSEQEADTNPVLAGLYVELATHGIDLDACTPDEEVRDLLGMPPLPVGGDGTGGDQDGRGHHPHVA